MKSVSNNFKQASIAPVKQVGGTITIFDDASSVTYTEDDNLISIELESSGGLFGTVAVMATIVLKGDNYDLVGKQLNIRYNLHMNEQGIEAINYGDFLVTEQPISKNKDSTTIKAISKMLQLGNESYSEIQGFPMSISDFAQLVADRFSIELSSMSGLPNASFQIQEDLYKNISTATYRSVLAEIAGATATTATISNSSNTLTFRPYQTTVQQSLDYTYLKSLTINDTMKPVNTLVLSRTPQEDNIILQDETIDDGSEIKIANNEILDDDRETTIVPLFDELKGISWTGFEATTVGLGWLECGDRVEITDSNDNTIEAIITYVKIKIDGGIKETIKGETIAKTETNYALAGGITKTIYNTEIKVDKQNQEIQSIVSEQTSFENQTNLNFTNITQNITSIVSSVQNSGGNNLIRNSAFFIKDSDGIYSNWTISGSGTITVTPSAEASVYGSLSKQIISLIGKTISQKVSVKQDDSSIPLDEKTYYSFSCRIKKTGIGSGTITITDGTQNWVISLPNGQTSNYKEFTLEGILPNSNELTISVAGSNDSDFAITDMMLCAGKNRSQWQQASGELANTQVKIDSTGVEVRSSTQSNIYSKQSTQGFTTYDGSTITSTLNSSGLQVEKANINSQIAMPPLKIVPQNDGWAFVANERNI